MHIYTHPKQVYVYVNYYPNEMWCIYSLYSPEYYRIRLYVRTITRNYLYALSPGIGDILITSPIDGRLAFC